MVRPESSLELTSDDADPQQTALDGIGSKIEARYGLPEEPEDFMFEPAGADRLLQVRRAQLARCRELVRVEASNKRNKHRYIPDILGLVPLVKEPDNSPL